MADDHPLSRRRLLHALGTGAGSLALARLAHAQVASDLARELPATTGPGPNPYWNSLGPYLLAPQKLPLLRLTDRPPNLETPRHYFRTALTPNEAFYVRWHLDRIPNVVDLSRWRLQVEGNVARPLRLSFDDLLKRFPAVTLAAVNQCSGNSRSRFQPRVAGGQWGNGAMGNAVWTGVRVRDLLAEAGAKPGTVQVQFEGLDRGPGPEGLGSNRFMKSLRLDDAVLDETLVAYAMNGAPIPHLNGFPARLVVPGYFGTYWVKMLASIRALDRPDDNFWMAAAYRIPDTPRGTTTPAEMAAGTVKTVPIGRMPVRSFLIAPDGTTKLPAGLPVRLEGIAFSGYGRITKVEVSTDDGRSWREAQLGDDVGRWAFRTWSREWTPDRPGTHSLAVRATDETGKVQTDEPVWNAGGYLWNRIERQEVAVGPAS